MERSKKNLDGIVRKYGNRFIELPKKMQYLIVFSWGFLMLFLILLLFGDPIVKSLIFSITVSAGASYVGVYINKPK